MSSLFDSLRYTYMKMRPPVKLILLVLLILIMALFGTLAAYLVSVPLYHIDMKTLETFLSNPGPENIGVIKLFQIFQSVFLFVIPALIAAWLFSTNMVGYLKAGEKASGITLILVVFVLFAAIPAMNMFTWINSRLDLPAWLDGVEKMMIASEENAAELTEAFLDGGSTADLAVNLFMIAILPAIGEEFLFRGVLQRIFTEWTRNNHWAIAITAFVFSFVHFQFFGFLPRFLLGLLFGYLMLWSASIWVPVAAHFVNNGIAVVYYHFSSKPYGETALDVWGISEQHYYVYTSAFLTCLLLGIIFLHEKERVRSKVE
jgi:membrane protease YdiL (CAAX protease family)